MNDDGFQLTEPFRKRLAKDDVILNRYRIKDVLGHGGMGEVFRCYDEIAGIDVAIKAIPPELSHDSMEMGNVRENFQLVEKLHHPNIAVLKTLEREPATGDYYLVMEYVDGVNLRQHQKTCGGKLAIESVIPIVAQIAEALDYAHRMKIIHRDIKPSNVMLEPDGTAKVLDFGIAAQVQSSMSNISRVDRPTSGTGPYMSPEQWRGERQGGRSDQYSLGVMTYTLLDGELPFSCHDTGVLREMILKELPSQIEGLNSAAWAALSRSLSKNPADRFPNCCAFAKALGSRNETALTGLAGLSAKLTSIRGRRLATAAALAVLAVGVTGIYFFVKQARLPAQPVPTRETISRKETMPPEDREAPNNVEIQAPAHSEDREQTLETTPAFSPAGTPGSPVQPKPPLKEAVQQRAPAEKHIETAKPKEEPSKPAAATSENAIPREVPPAPSVDEDQKRAETRQKMADELIKSGDSLREKNELEAALAKYREAQELIPLGPDLANRIVEISDALVKKEEAIQRHEIEQARILENKRIAGELVIEGNAAMDRGEPENALEYYSKALDLTPGDESIEKLIVEAKKRIEETSIEKSKDTAEPQKTKRPSAH